MIDFSEKKTPWHFAGKSDTGRIRKTNEDAFFCDEERGAFLAVADGVGCLEFGERASAEAIATAREIFSKTPIPFGKTAPDFLEIFEKIDTAVASLGEKLASDCGGIATTLALAVDGGNGKIHFAHVGDSAIFALRDGEFSKLSEEHTLAAESRARGNEVFPANYINTLTRVLGLGRAYTPQVFSVDFSAGDRVLMATDGVFRALSQSRLKEIISTAGTPAAAAEQLVHEAVEKDGSDNATAVVAFI